ncbi:MAG: AI-2E family transporter, partial [Lachnospiraceae bacterium]|nr:AI-2E family transporter [Lachnospiraceae bacterium]
WAEYLIHVSRTFSRSFANFLSGQCAEAVILGVLMFLAFTIFRLPYGSLIGVLTAVCAIIPYVGAFISGAVSVILALLISPTLAVRCLIVYLVVQFVENQFIYPRVVGGSVGLPPLYTLIAAMIGGKLFGIIGIIFFIPIMAVVIELVKEDAGKRLSRRGKSAV